MERSGCRRSLLRGEGLPDSQPREREFHGGHCGAESLGGRAFELAGRGVGWLGCGPAVCALAGVGGCGGCGGHCVRGISLGVSGLRARPQRHGTARAGKSHWLVTILKAYDGRSAIEATVGPPSRDRGNQGAKIPDEWRAAIGLGYGAARDTPARFVPPRRIRPCWCPIRHFVDPGASGFGAVFRLIQWRLVRGYSTHRMAAGSIPPCPWSMLMSRSSLVFTPSRVAGGLWNVVPIGIPASLALVRKQAIRETSARLRLFVPSLCHFIAATWLILAVGGMWRRRKAKTIFTVALVSLAVLGSDHVLADPVTDPLSDVVFGNLGVSGTNALGGLSTNLIESGPSGTRIAMSFVTGSAGPWQLGGLRLGIGSPTSRPVPFALITEDDAGNPLMSAIAAFYYRPGDGNYTTTGSYDFTPAFDAELQPSTTYWLFVGDDSTDPSSFGWYDNAAAESPTAQNDSGWSFGATKVSLDGGSTWDGYSAGNSVAFSITAVPEPSTWAMGLAGIACAGWGAFRRRKRA
jgi:hypothetical protein